MNEKINDIINTLDQLLLIYNLSNNTDKNKGRLVAAKSSLEAIQKDYIIESIQYNFEQDFINILNKFKTLNFNISDITININNISLHNGLINIASYANIPFTDKINFLTQNKNNILNKLEQILTKLKKDVNNIKDILEDTDYELTINWTSNQYNIKKYNSPILSNNNLVYSIKSFDDQMLTEIEEKIKLTNKNDMDIEINKLKNKLKRLSLIISKCTNIEQLEEIKDTIDNILY